VAFRCYIRRRQEYLDYGLHGIALSRYTGLWVSMKCVTEVVESGASSISILNASSQLFRRFPDAG
jgi:TPP-dependent indolepyruvate ferredoxin oxidoreductase alpha subunit